jgi:hypothetical protein
MFCPNCHYEYVLGVTKCPDCVVDLVYALPPNPPKDKQAIESEQNLVTVFRSRIFPNLAIAKSILEDAGIEYITSGGRGGIGGNVIQVFPDDAEEAVALLADLAKEG